MPGSWAHHLHQPARPNMKTLPASQQGQEGTNRSADAAAWALNITSSVSIVFINKVLMDPKHGHGFVFATCLCALHFLVSGLAMRTSEWLGYQNGAAVPWKDVLGFSLIAGISIASLNLSLLVNSVGFYQVSKLLIIPFVCLLEGLWLRRSFTLPVLVSVAMVVAGVAVVTVTDVTISMLGFSIAMLSVVSSGLQQILCGVVQRQHDVTSTQLLSKTAPLQGAFLMLVGPSIDHLISGRSITTYRFTTLGAEWLLLSCVMAVLVNVSQFVCLGRFSALTFQVLGHTKTLLVLLIGWLFLYDGMNPRKLVGIMMAVAGMVAYGWLNSARQPLTLLNERHSSTIGALALESTTPPTIKSLQTPVSQDNQPEHVMLLLPVPAQPSPQLQAVNKAR